ncbi:hypothetical protein B0H16DRAFT_1642910 [Mycena metata]|uniref:ATP-binding cassette transporter n=1 Tax=Mycena metata TaxID=1033252 RepID=A0AAD7DVY2_9AGAR|nr:hypothetical protein B0H16DRAFT_1642910 [Mycena metata]
MVLDHLPDIGSGNSQDLLFVPAYASAISAAILLVHVLLTLTSVNGFLQRVGILTAPKNNVSPQGIGKGALLRFRIARLLGCLGLLALSVFSSVHQEIDASRTRSNKLFSAALLAAPYVYGAILASLTISPAHTRRRLVRHVNGVLFLAFCVYVYRDVLPLATYTHIPADLDEGRVLWAKTALLFITAVLIPVSTPRQYIPVDPTNPPKAVNPEQTASFLSFAFFSFLDPIIFLAYRQSALAEEQLYPLCDTDSATHLKNQSFKYLDSFSGSNANRHIFFGLMRVFWREFSTLIGLQVLRVLTNYSGYIETRDQETTVVRPWVWIAMIFLGPVFGTLLFQLTLVRVESIISQLVFAHRQAPALSANLRIRVKAETTSASDDSTTLGSGAESTAEPATPENGESEGTTVQASTSSAKSGTTTVTQPSKPTKDESKKSDGKSLVGKINNLVTTDLENITDSRDFVILIVFIPLQITLGIWFLYVLLGWSVFVGVASIILLTPVPGYLAKLVQSVQKERMKRTDSRVQSVSEAVNVLRMVKLFGWEGKMQTRIDEKRDEELIYIRRRRVLDMLSNLVKCTLLMGQPLNASKVFSSMTIFDMLRYKTTFLTYWLNNVMTGKVSLDRVDAFLKETELLDAFDEKEAPILFAPDASTDERIGFRNATFAWSKEDDGGVTPSRKQFTLRIDGELLFERGKINLVVGPTGSGEMHWIPSSPDSWYNLPRSSGVAYATQESWVLNETIRSNIVFDTPFDEERYKKVLYQCALEPDLALFQAGDATEVGEKGAVLDLHLLPSGGQKARLTLARAVYSKASILLLDDILAALDWIVEHCLGGDLIENRTVILVTHNIALTHSIADFVVTFGSDGRVRSLGSISELTKRGTLAAQIRKEQQVLDKTDQEVDTEDPVAPVADTSKPADGKLIVAEEIQMGHIGSSPLKMYFLAMGGKYPIFFFVLFFAGLFFDQIVVALRVWMLGYWASQYDVLPADQVNVVLPVAIVATSSITLAVVFIYLVYGQLRASKVIHKDLIGSVLTAPLRWLDVTPSSRIIARVTNDVKAVDDALAQLLWPLSRTIVAMIVKLIVVVMYTPLFLLPGVLVALLGVWVGQIYIAGQMPVKRLMSNFRAPVLAHFGSAIAGLVSIRAYGAQSKFNAESLTKIDRYTRAARNYYNLNRWVGIRIDILGSFFSASLAAYLVYVKQSSAGEAGFLINQALGFCGLLLWAVRATNDFEVQGQCLERIQAYIEIDHEKVPTEAGKPPAYWPASGELRVERLSARYSENGPEVLHDISFHVKAGERVGIVAQSSLTLSLLRCIPTEGSVRYDGIETSELNLDALRSSITIIPQVPELLSGTLRANLDPFGQYDDAELNFALRAAGLSALQSEMDEGRITLDSNISSGGGNLSVGQRQIFALARAIVRKSKILILDEDYKTDSIIQTSLRQELQGDVSLITVAHRLQTIMDADKIMVLDAGRIVEFDTPKELLKIKDGKLRALVDESGDRDTLFAMAGAA